MKNNELLRIYNEYLVIDPDKSKLESSGILSKYDAAFNKYKAGKDRLTVISDLYEGMVNQIAYSGSYGYFGKPYSGVKALVDPEYEFFVYIESWWPSSADVFDFAKPILLPCIAEIIKTRFGCSLSDLPVTYTGDDFFKDIFPDFKDYISTQEWFGFNLGDKYNYNRIRSIKRRRLKFNAFSLRPPRFGMSFAEVEFIDRKSKEKIYVSPGYGWELFYSEELMNNRLHDIEMLWLQRYDSETKCYDNKIRKLERELREAKRVRKEVLGKTVEFQKKIKNILWKDF